MFDRESVAELSRAARAEPVGNPEEIALKLADVASRFFLARWSKAAPASHQVLSSLNAMREAAEKLLRKTESKEGAAAFHHVALQILAHASHPDYGDLASGIERPKATAAAIRDLLEWIRAADTLERRRSDKRRGHTGDEAVQALIDGLAAVWTTHWCGDVSASRHPITGEARGPFIRFVVAFVDIVDAGVSDMSLAIDPGLARALKRVTPEKILRHVKKSKMRTRKLPR